MDHAELSRIVNNLAGQYVDAKTPGYFECLDGLDSLEFYVLDFMDQTDTDHEMDTLREQAARLHTHLASIAQSSMDHLVQDIRSHHLTAPALKQLFNQYAHSVADQPGNDVPDYDLFDDFLSHLFQIDYEPSETRRRTQEMLYLQPTPGRIILEMLNTLPFSANDCFYDLGSGLGRVPILVSLLTEAYAVGIEYEPTYTHYSECAAHKLGIDAIAFRNLDVQDADLSEGTIFFMYTPFSGSILRKVLNRLRQLSQERPITLCTYGPCTPVIEQENWLYPLRPSNGTIHRLAIFSSVGGL